MHSGDVIRSAHVEKGGRESEPIHPTRKLPWPPGAEGAKNPWVWLGLPGAEAVMPTNTVKD